MSADLCWLAIGEAFEVDETRVPGLSDALLGTVPVQKTMLPIDLPSGRVVQFVPSVAVPSNPAEFLASRQLGDLLAEVSRDADCVLLDCPPALPVSDMLGIAQFVDGIVMLAVPGRTRTHQLSEACDRLRSGDAGMLGE